MSFRQGIFNRFSSKGLRQRVNKRITSVSSPISKRARKRLLGNGGTKAPSAPEQGIKIRLDRAEKLVFPADVTDITAIVQVFIGDTLVYLTPGVEGSSDPVWNSSHFQAMNDFDQEMRIVIKGFYEGDKGYIGECSVKLNDYFGAQSTPRPKSVGDLPGKNQNVNVNKEVRMVQSVQQSKATSHTFEQDLVNKKTGDVVGRIYFRLSHCKQAPAPEIPSWEINVSDPCSNQLILDVVRGTNLAVMDTNGKSDPFCKITFQSKSKRTKHVKYTVNPEWLQAFDFPYDPHLYDKEGFPEADTIEIEIWDKDRFGRSDYMGKGEINLRKLGLVDGEARNLWLKVELNGQPAGFINVIVSLFGVLYDQKIPPVVAEKKVGIFRLYVIQGRKPRSKKKKAVTYVEAQIGMNKIRTQPVEDSPSPEFGRIIELPVKDLFSSVKISLYEKRRDAWEEAPTFVGMMEFRLLDRTYIDDEWFILKDEGLERAKDAQLRLSFKFTYSNAAFIKCLSGRRELDPMQKKNQWSMAELKLQLSRCLLWKKKIQNAQSYVVDIMMWNYGIQKSLNAMLLWAFLCLFYRPWFLPLGLFTLLMYTKNNKNLFNGDSFQVDSSGRVIKVVDVVKTPTRIDANGQKMDQDILPEDSFELDHAEFQRETIYESRSEDSDREYEDTQADKQSFMQKLALPGKMLRKVQNLGQSAADYSERFVGVFTWTNYDLTFILCILSVIGTFILMVIPINIVMLVVVEGNFIKYGLRKYGFAFLHGPHYVSYQQPFEFLKIVPTWRERQQHAKVAIPSDLQDMLEHSSIRLAKDFDGGVVETPVQGEDSNNLKLRG